MNELCLRKHEKAFKRASEVLPSNKNLEERGRFQYKVLCCHRNCLLVLLEDPFEELLCRLSLLLLPLGICRGSDRSDTGNLFRRVWAMALMLGLI